MHEIWLPVVGYEGFYEVSNHGRVRSVDRVVPYRVSKTRKVRPFNQSLLGRILKPGLTKPGYLAVGLSTGNGGKTLNIHRLVAEAFIPNPSSLPHVNHISGIKTQNSANNLEWCTVSQNLLHAFATGLKSSRSGERNHLSKLKDCEVLSIRSLLNDGLSQRKVAAIYGVSQHTIAAISLRHTWAHI